MAIGITALGAKKVKDERANLKISKDTSYELQLLRLTNNFKSVDELLKDMIEVYKNEQATKETNGK